MANATMPDCFGDLWDRDAVECSGGFDGGFVSTNGSHIRPKCDFFDQCRVRTSLKAQQSQYAPVVPAANLTRNQPGYAWPGWQAPVVPGRQPMSGGQPVQPVQHAQPMWTAPQPMWPPGMQQYAMQAAVGHQEQMDPQMLQMLYMMQLMQTNPYLPQPMYPGRFPMQGNINPIAFHATNYEMPGYLSVPEPRDGGFWPTLGREVFRGMGKALGHSIASFFDHVPLRGK